MLRTAHLQLNNSTTTTHNPPSDVQVAADDIVHFLQRCQDPGGGFGGGPGQLPHLAPSYAAVATLVTLGSREALEVRRRSARHASLVPHELRGFVGHARGFMYD